MVVMIRMVMKMKNNHNDVICVVDIAVKSYRKSNYL